MDSVFLGSVRLGQTKSKWFFQADVSSKKNQMNEFNFTTMIPQVDLFSFILEEIEDTKKTFRNELTFKKIMETEIKTT